MAAPKQLPLAGYIRVSRQGDRTEEKFRSPDWQREKIAALGRKRGREIRWYEQEIDVSGAKPVRAVLDDVLRDVKAGVVGGVVIAKLDRLSRLPPRDRVELFDLIEKEHGGIVLSAAEELEPNSPENRFTRNMFLELSRMQWEQAKEQFDRAKAGAIKQGIPVHTRVPVGYKTGPDRKLVVDPNVAPHIHEAFILRGRGMSYADIGAFLRARGVRTSQGSEHWARQAVSQLLRSRVYRGEIRYGKDGSDLVVRNTEAHEAIVDEVVWQLAQPKPKPVTQVQQPRTGRYPLTGALRCGSCGYSLQGTEGRPGVRHYRCVGKHSGGECPKRMRAPAERVEPAAESLFWWFVDDIAATGQEMTKPDVDLDALRQRVEDAQAYHAEMSTLRMRKAMGDQYMAALEERADELANAVAAFAAATAAEEATGVAGMSATTLRAEWDGLTPADKRTMYAAAFVLALHPGDDGEVLLAVYRHEDVPMLSRPGYVREPQLRPLNLPDAIRVLPLEDAPKRGAKSV